MKVLLRGYWPAWAALLWIATAGGCGVGIGGTGTGAALPAFQASPTAVCEGDFADRLECPAPTGAPSPSPAGTSLVRFVDARGRLVLEIDGNEARLDESCLQLHFDGSYGKRADGTLAFFGSHVIDASGPEILSSLIVSKADPDGLSIELRDIGGQLIIAAATLQRAGAALPLPGPCGG